ncbi:MAG: HD domain-containing protein [Terrimicrobiaceae bacterium]|nr:HD domain-containing protein [Terrimicrobiaceae bacterium]
MTIAAIRGAVKEKPAFAELHAQVEQCTKKEGSNGKPFWELRLRDASDALTLRVWSDSANVRVCESLEDADCVSVEGEFHLNGSFGLDARRWELRRLMPDERTALFEGSEAERAAVDEDYASVERAAAGLRDPRLRALAARFLETGGARFRRAAAARMNHHARRGGLVQHTAQMLRAAAALCDVYPALNRDLLLAGVLFHDCGKLWETCPPEEGFAIRPDPRGELMGHISIGVEVVNALWRELPKADWEGLAPASDDVRLHLIHLILSHHGALEFGSPVLPKTPEAIALHYIDNLDARLEMIAQAYAGGKEIAPGIFDRVRPLEVGPMRSLGIFDDSDSPQGKKFVPSDEVA